MHIVKVGFEVLGVVALAAAAAVALVVVVVKLLGKAGSAIRG